MLWSAARRLGKMPVIPWNKPHRNKPKTKYYKKIAARLYTGGDFLFLKLQTSIMQFLSRILKSDDFRFARAAQFFGKRVARVNDERREFQYARIIDAAVFGANNYAIGGFD